ncbi:tyrosine-type recombinase/integrase [Oenococcus oeni]|uniref:tyrosine-type recombinase/integrase n=1 Tax=Oenococcus oeni TaxID=1247 RepID=UPI00029833BE|nr:tyrosine-type recombinase/integrase [Oenococcus oeni]EKP90040.1 phage integrase [Oenococcus oeni DSM 20252 = AWRIB129]OIL18385.1 integrase [Oenococcus oeni]OIL21765.1 integrase [Oenococcus oeni]OIL40936.1 integrase [Oenococcus oeni]OIL46845.1 integrase [Oenococcus oeni]
MIKKIITHIDNKNKTVLFYQAVYQPRDPASLIGKRKNYIGSRFDSLQQAQDQEKSFIADFTAYKKSILSDSITLKSTFADAYYRFYLSNSAPRREPRTIDFYHYELRLIGHYFKNKTLGDLNETMFKRFAIQYSTGKSKSAGSAIAKHLGQFHKLFDYLVDRGILSTNFIPKNYLRIWFGGGIRFNIENHHKKSVLDRVLTSKDIHCLRNQLTNTNLTYENFRYMTSRLAILIDAVTGLRPAEVLALKFSDLKFDGHNYYFHIHDSYDDLHHIFNGRTKTGYDRETLAINPRIIKLIKRYMNFQTLLLKEIKTENSGQLIFLNINDYQKAGMGYPITQAALNKTLKIFARKYQFENADKISLYFLRHTVATELFHQLPDRLEVAAQFMGHSTEMFIKTYVRPQTDEISSHRIQLS